MPTRDEVGMWRVEEDTDGVRIVWRERGQMEEIATIQADRDTAEFILRACQSHHELVDVCKGALGTIEALAENSTTDTMLALYSEHAEAIRAAIAKTVKGQP